MSSSSSSAASSAATTAASSSTSHRYQFSPELAKTIMAFQYPPSNDENIKKSKKDADEYYWTTTPDLFSSNNIIVSNRGVFVDPKSGEAGSQQEEDIVGKKLIPLLTGKEVEPAELIRPPASTSSSSSSSPRFDATEVCVVNNDTITTALALQKLDPEAKIAALNFANAEIVGGLVANDYAIAQEEEVIRAAPELYTSLLKGKKHYPLDPTAALYSSDVYVLRHGRNKEIYVPKRRIVEDAAPASAAASAVSQSTKEGEENTNEDEKQSEIEKQKGEEEEEKPKEEQHQKLLGKCDFITAAFPVCGYRSNEHFFEEGGEWWLDVTGRARAILHAAKQKGVNTLLLGAIGAGMFGNDPKAVAQVLAKQLQSEEFRGCFKRIVHPVLDWGACPKFKAFEKVFNNEEFV